MAADLLFEGRKWPTGHVLPTLVLVLTHQPIREQLVQRVTQLTPNLTITKQLTTTKSFFLVRKQAKHHLKNKLQLNSLPR